MSKPAPATSDQVATLLRQPPADSSNFDRPLIGRMLLNPQDINDVAVAVPSSTWLCDQKCCAIYDAIKRLYDADKPTDAQFIMRDMEEHGVRNVTHQHLNTMMEAASETRATTDELVAKIRDLHHRRSIRQQLLEAVVLATESSDSSEDIQSKVEAAVQQAAPDIQVGTGPQKIGRDAESYINAVQNDDVVRYRLGYPELDDIVEAEPGDYIVIAARPSQGKTSVGLNFADYLSVKSGVPGCMFMLEGTRRKLSMRSLAIRTGIESRRIRHNDLMENEKQRIRRAIEQLEQAPFFVDEASSISTTYLRATIRRLVNQHDIKYVMIDYLQLMRQPRAGRREYSRYQELTDISNEIKAIGKDYGVVIFTLAQLNRLNEQRSDIRPRISDIKECGTIEQDADSIILLHRQDYYDRNDIKKGVKSPTNTIDLDVAKNKENPTGLITLAWDGPTFTMSTPQHLPHQPAMTYQSDTAPAMPDEHEEW